MVTHELDIALHCRRIIRFKDGDVVSDEPVPEPVEAAEQLAGPLRPERKEALA
jgi:putative ABC transport system ATP-binding protein